jgi:hypothetical protein
MGRIVEENEEENLQCWFLLGCVFCIATLATDVLWNMEIMMVPLDPHFSIVPQK